MSGSSTFVVPLTIRDLRADDFAGLAWSGGSGYLREVTMQFERLKTGAVDYLVAVLPSGRSVGKGLVDYVKHLDAGELFQLSVHDDLQSCGIGTALIAESERRIRAKGLPRAEIGAQVDNPRALALYERLGYVAYCEKQESWDELLADGTSRRHEATCVFLRKELGSA